MAKGLAKTKWIHAGHKVSATHILCQVDKLLEVVMLNAQVDTAKLSQLKLSLEEELDNLKLLDSEILEHTEEKNYHVEEIDQADTFKQGIYATLINIEKHCTLR